MSHTYAQIPSGELHLLYILLDSNLPTGGFVSSSGLESYVKHGFLGLPSSSSASIINKYNHKIDEKERGFTAVKGIKDVIRGVTDFAEAEVGQYASTTGCFVKESWGLVSFSWIPTAGSSEAKSKRQEEEEGRLKTVLKNIGKLDEYHESTLLSHVARRASKAQGVAMLTLYGRGLSRPVGFESMGVLEQSGGEEGVKGEGEGKEDLKEKRAKDLIDAYKLLVRKGSVPGHLAICWGVITAALGLTLGMSSIIPVLS